MSEFHPLIEGVDAICDGHRKLCQYDGLFESLYKRIRENWASNRELGRWPTDKNWVLRVTREFTQDPRGHLEKQLQKKIAICLENEGWGNDVPTASGLVNSGSRQMNIDLAHSVTDGFELVELKWESNKPYEAAFQILRYGAVYMLYRLEPDLAMRFKSNAMLSAKRIVLEVLAPLPYYDRGDVDLRCLELQLNRGLDAFAKRDGAGQALSFRFRAFPPDFVYEPGMNCDLIRDAVHRRASPLPS